MSDLVSIIITTYNRAALLRETINSCLQQTYAAYEIIVVDDGSTDNTKQVLEDLIASGNIIYHYQANAERAAARNTGAYIASGRYIKFLDSDDLLGKDYVQNCLLYFNKFPACDIVYTNCFVQYDNGRVITQSKKGVVAGFYEKLWEYNDVSLSAVMMTKAAFMRSGGFDITRILSGAEDWEYWVRLSKEKYNFGFIHDFLVTIKVHAANSTMNDVQKIIYSTNVALDILAKKYNDIDSRLVKRMKARLLYIEAVYHSIDGNSTQSLRSLFAAALKNKRLFLSRDLYILLIKNILPMRMVSYIKKHAQTGATVA